MAGAIFRIECGGSDFGRRKQVIGVGFWRPPICYQIFVSVQQFAMFMHVRRYVLSSWFRKIRNYLIVPHSMSKPIFVPMVSERSQRPFSNFRRKRSLCNQNAATPCATMAVASRPGNVSGRREMICRKKGKEMGKRRLSENCHPAIN